ncbi:MAG: hypothetical protein RIQ33_1161 [Bacteroidota bacterium]|jgi:hypothetical protein
MKKILILLCFVPTLTFARKMPVRLIDDQAYVSQPRFKHYVGVQSNLLIRQILNLSGSTASTNNPYLITYAINNRKGWGLATGLGLVTSSTSISDAIGNSDKKSTQTMNLRIGAEKRFNFHAKWNGLIGIDGLMNIDKSTSDVKEVQMFSTNSINTNSTKNESNGYGAAIRAALNYSITPRILIGTETNLGFTAGNEKFSGSTYLDDGFGNVNTTTTSNSSKVSGFNINVPTAIFVIIKF